MSETEPGMNVREMYREIGNIATIVVWKRPPADSRAPWICGYMVLSPRYRDEDEVAEDIGLTFYDFHVLVEEIE